MSALATDAFTRANSTGISNASWTTANSSSSFNINTNQAVAVPGAITGNYYSGVVWPNNQYGQVTVRTPLVASADEGVGPWIRMATGALTGYFLQGGSTDTRFYKVVAGSFTQLGSTDTACANGDVLKLVANGTTITPTRNGVSICGGPVTDSSIASGNVGMWGSTTGTAAGVDDFEGGDLTGGGGGSTQQKLPLFGVSVIVPLAWIIDRRQRLALEKLERDDPFFTRLKQFLRGALK